MEILAKLFGSAPLVKIMRLFLFHPDEPLDAATIRSQAKLDAETTRWATGLLASIGFLKRRVFQKNVYKGRGKKRKIVKKKTRGFVLHSDFSYTGPLYSLLVNTELMSEGEIEKKLKNVGKLKLVLIAGVFIQDRDSRIDLLVVGDHLNKKSLGQAIRSLEAEIGTELRYAAFETEEFLYRIGIYDKLVRDILDFPHHRIVDKLEV